jgi:hypothetical protein
MNPCPITRQAYRTALEREKAGAEPKTRLPGRTNARVLLLNGLYRLQYPALAADCITTSGCGDDCCIRPMRGSAAHLGI